MKYSEYQVWFHAFNTAITAFGNKNISVQDLITRAEEVAEYALSKFKKVQQTPESTLESLDLNKLVQEVTKHAIK